MSVFIILDTRVGTFFAGSAASQDLMNKFPHGAPTCATPLAEALLSFDSQPNGSYRDLSSDHHVQ